jgi:predicted thioesterase
MKHAPQVGATGEQRFVVDRTHIIDFATDGMPAVLCTPWLIWFLEHAAREVALPLLEPGESTVGVHVDVKHLAATPLGHEVTCRARVIHVEGPVITFQLEARDQHELVARGHHKLCVIRVDRFALRVQQKMGAR